MSSSQQAWMIEAEIDMQLDQLAGSLTPEEKRAQKQKLLDEVLKEGQRDKWLQRFIAEEMLYRRAREEKLGDDPGFKSLVGNLERQILAQKLLDQEFAKRVSITPDVGQLDLYRLDRALVAEVRALAYSMAASRLVSSNDGSFHGAMILSCGARAMNVSSNRTWSLPLPVAPWLTASAFSFRATSTWALAISGRAIEVPSM